MRRRKHSETGFSLLETLLGLSLLGLVLMLGLGVLWQQPAAERRLAAHSEALLAMEGLLEGIRAGAPIPPPKQPVIIAEEVGPGMRQARGLRLWVVTESVGAAELRLLEVEITARYQVAGRTLERSMRSRLWRP